MNERPSLEPTPEHIMQLHSGFARQDRWKLDDISLCSSGHIAVSGHKEYTDRSYVCVFSTVDNSDSRDKQTLLYNKEFKDKDSIWQRISFMEPNFTEIVACQGDEVHVIDYTRDLVLRSRKVNGETTCLSVSESQIFIGLWRSDIVYIYDKDLNRIKSIRLKEIRGDGPLDMTAAADRLYVRTYYGRAIVYSQNSGSILTEYKTGNKARSVTVNVQIAIVAVLWHDGWSKRQVAVYSFTDNNCLFVFDVESGVSRIRISDQGRIVTGNKNTGEVKIYDWKQVPFDSLSVGLAQLMSLDEIEELRKHFSISVKDTEVCNVDDEALKSKHVKKLLTILKEKGIFSPNNRNELKALFEKLGHLPASKLIAPILLYQKYASVYQNDSLQQHQSAVDAGSSNNPFNVSPSHSVPEQSFPNPDNLQNQNVLDVTSTEHGLVCYIRSGMKRGENVLTQLFKLPSSESSDIPQLIYSNAVARQGYKDLFLTFIDGTHLVMCYSKTIDIIDINSKEVVRECQLSAAARSMSVEERKIFVVVGNFSEVLIFNEDLQEVSKSTIKLEKWKYPTDMTVSSGRLYIICQVRPGQHSGGHNWPVRAMSFRRGDGEMIARYVIPGEKYEPVSITANKESEFVGVLWSVRKVSLHALSGDCLFVLDVVDSRRIRLVNKTTMVVIASTNVLNYYNVAHFFTVKALAIRLSHFITGNEFKNLQSFYGISEEQIRGKDSVRRYDVNVTEVQRRLVLLFKILGENSLVSPNNLDGLLDAVGKSHSSVLWSLMKAFWEVSDKISSIGGSSPEVPVQGYVHDIKEDDREGAASVIHQEDKMELESSNPGISLSQPLISTLQQQQQQHFQHLQQQGQQLTTLLQQKEAQQQHVLTFKQQAQQEAVFVNQPAALYQRQLYQKQQLQNQMYQHQSLAQQQQWQQLGHSPRHQQQQLLGYSQSSGFDPMDAPSTQKPPFTQQTFSNRAAFHHQPQEALYQQAARYNQPQQASHNFPLYSQQPHSSSPMLHQQQQQVTYPFQQQQGQHHPFNQPHTSLQQQGTTSYSGQLEYQPFAEQIGAGQETIPSTSGHQHPQQGGAGSIQVTEGSPMTVDSSPEREVTKDDTESFSDVNLFTNLEAKSHPIDDLLTDIEYDRLRELHIDKKSLFIVCLKKKITSWCESKTIIPWEKSGRWRSTDVFVGCGLTLTDTKSHKNIDEPCKLMYTEILNHDKLKLERRIIIAGGPGTGKTMLSIQLACDWSEGKLKDVDILIFVPLKFVGGKQIVQAIKELYIPAEMPISEQDIEGILASDSEEICLIFDGLERYCPGGGQISRESSEVMKVVNKEIHPTCKVVVTTCSGLTEDLQEYPLLKIERFSELERKSYIEKLFPEYVKKQMKLQEIIEDNSFLLDLCDVPLLFTLVIHSIESMTISEDIQCDKVAPFVIKIVETLCSPTTVEHETWPKNEELTLGELAFSGLCKGQQQLSWKKDILEKKIENLNHWIESRILVLERDISEKGKDSQTIGEKNEKMGQMMKEKGNDTEEEGNETNTKTSHMLAQSKVQQYEESEGKSNKVTFSVRFLHKVIQEWFAATYFSSMMKRFTDEDQFHEYITNQLRHISPKDLHYFLRFTCYLHPPSTHAIMNYLLTSYCSKDGDIESYIMDCICLCFTEHNDIRSPYMKNSVEEVCKEVITFDSQDGRLLQQAKSSLLQYASDCGIIIQELLLINAIAAVDETSLTLSSRVKLGLLNTLEMVVVSQRHKPLYQDDFANIVKFLTKGKCIKNILFFCPSQPPEPLDEVTMETVFHKNVEVQWSNGYVIWTLDAKKGTFLPVYGQMTNAGDIGLKGKEGVMSYEDFQKSQPGTSASALEKLPMKRSLKRMQFFDLESESAAKQLKRNWDLKPGAKLFKKEEIFDVPMDTSMVSDDEKASLSGVELVVKEETLAEDAEPKLIKEEIIDSDVEEMVDESENLGGDIEEDGDTSKSSVMMAEMKVEAVDPFTKAIVPGMSGKFESEDKKIPQSSFAEIHMPDSEESGEEIQELPTSSSHGLGAIFNKCAITPESKKQRGSDFTPVATLPGKMTKVVPEETGVKDVKQVQLTERQLPLQTEATITKSGGMLQIPNTGVVLVVPPNALPEDLVQCKMQMKIICNVMEEDQEASFSSNSSAVVELLPDNLTLQHPVKLMLPHCLVLGDTKDYSAKIFISHHRQGDSPHWEEQSHLSYHLEDTTCTIFLDSFCWVKYLVNEKIVKARKIVVFAAAEKLHPQDDVATIAVGFCHDLPGKGCKFLQKNPSFIITHMKTYLFRKRKRCYPLQFSLDKIFPSGWQNSEETQKEVSYEEVASEPEHAFFYLLQKKENTADSPLCVVMAMQEKGEIPVHLAAYPKGSNMDTLSSSGAHIHLPLGQAFLMTETVITRAGGTCEIHDTGVVLQIPEGALPADKEECKIQMRIIFSRKVQDDVTSFSSNSSVAVELSPSDLSLQCPVKLVLPHCLKFKENVDHSVRIYTKYHGEGNMYRIVIPTESQSQWEEQTNLKYRLEDSACIVWMDKLCCVKYAVNDEIVIGKKIVLYTAARKDIQKKEIADVEVGYFPDIPGAGELLRLNPDLTVVKNMLSFKEEQNHPLHLLLYSIVPPKLLCCFPEEKTQEIPFRMVAWSIEHSYLYVFQKNDERVGNPVCKFKAFQEGGNSSTELIVKAFSQQDALPTGTVRTEKRTSDEDPMTATFQFLQWQLSSEWQDVGRALGILDSTLTQIEADSQNKTRKAIYQMLRHWKQDKGAKADLSTLMDALKRAKRTDLAERVQKEFLEDSAI